MKKIGLVGVADATTLIGDVVLAPGEGLETVSGKSSDPVPQSELAGSCAVGAGNLLVLADHVIATGGVVGKEGEVGVGLGVGVGVGAGVVVVALGVPPHPIRKVPAEITSANFHPDRIRLDIACIKTILQDVLPTQESRIGAANNQIALRALPQNMKGRELLFNTQITLRDFADPLLPWRSTPNCCQLNTYAIPFTPIP
jgi:hypothetical protein